MARGDSEAYEGIDNLHLAGFSMPEKAEVLSFPPLWQKKAARNIRFRKDPDIIQLPPEEACDRCAKDSWPCFVNTQDQFRAAETPFKKSCTTCYHQACSFSTQYRDDYVPSPGGGPSNGDVEAGRPTRTARAKATANGSPYVNGRQGEDAPIVDLGNETPDAEYQPSPRRGPKPKAARQSMKATTSATPAVPKRAPQTATAPTPSPAKASTRPKRKASSPPVRVKSSPPPSPPAVPEAYPDPDAAPISVPRPDKGKGRAHPPQLSSHSRSHHTPPTPVSLPHDLKRLSTTSPRDAASAASHSAKRRRKDMMAYKMIGLRDPDAEQWPAPDDAYYNVSRSLWDVDPNLQWELLSPFDSSSAASANDGGAPRYQGLRPSEVDRIPFLKRVVTISDDIASILHQFGLELGIVGQGTLPHERYLPPYLYQPRRTCVRCTNNGTPCIMSDVPRPPPSIGTRRPLINLIPIGPCICCLTTQDPHSECVWRLNLGGQAVDAKMYALAWPSNPGVDTRRLESEDWMDERAVWFDPNDSAVAVEEQAN